MNNDIIKIIITALGLITLWAMWRFVQPQWRRLSLSKRGVMALLLVSLFAAWVGALMEIRWVWIVGTLGISLSQIINLYFLYREAENG
jgi:hypothetical protein